MSSIAGAAGPSSKNAPQDVTTVQRSLQRYAAWLQGTAPGVSGKFDDATAGAIIAVQTNAAAMSSAGGIVSPSGFTMRRPELQAISKPARRIFLPVCWNHPEGGISDADYEAAAKALSCTTAAIKAVAETETKRAAWEDVGRPTILFERHYFSRLTDRAYDHTHPDISNPASGGYGLFKAQYGKL